MRQLLRAIAVMMACAIFLSACNRTEETDTAAREVPGITDSEIRIGSSLALTGHASYLGIQTLRGALSYIKHVNENGGVHGRKIVLTAKDDGYDPPRCLVNTQQLIIEEDVFSLFCYVGTPTTIKIVPLVDEAKIPLIGMFTGANALREPFNRYLINIRASYYQETGTAVKHLVEDLGVRKIAVFYQYDAYGFDGLTGTELALKDYGLAPIARGTYVRGTQGVEEGLERIMDSGAEAVVLIGTYEPCAKFIKLAKAGGYNPYFYNVSFVGADELARLLGPENEENVIMSQVVPPPDEPESQSLLWGTAEYTELLKKYFPEDKPNFVGLEGYINARVLVEGLKRAGRTLDRERFIDAIESMHDYSLGLDNILSFSQTDHQGLERVYFTRLVDGKFALITDWSTIKKARPAKDR